MKQTTPVRRRPALAMILSAMLPGLGQIYNGELDKGIYLFLAFAFLVLPLLTLVALVLPPVLTMPALILALLASVGVYVYGILDARRVARHSPLAVPADWQRPGVYLALLLFCDLMVLPAAIDWVRGSLVESFWIPSHSMAPSVLRGDILFADKRVNRPGAKRSVRRGDLAVFVYPNDRTKYYIKRIIGLPGDRIAISGADVSVNGVSISTSGSSEDSNGIARERGDDGYYEVMNVAGMQQEALQVEVPQGRVFVLGDNRARSSDSRAFGTVPLSDVVGLARQVWFSWSDETGVRWDRLGLVLQAGKE